MDVASVEPKLRRAKRRLALRRFLLGRAHLSTGDAYYQTGLLLRLAGEMEGAARCLAMAERIHRKRLGPGHPTLALDLLAIGEYQAQWGERQRALHSFERAECILEANIRKNAESCHPAAGGVPLRQHLGHLLWNMGVLHGELDQAGKSRTYFERALRLVVEEEGPASRRSVDLAYRLARMGVDPRALVRELGGEPAASALVSAYREAHGTDPSPEPIS